MKPNAEKLIELFGGVKAMSVATKLDMATISRWHKPGKRSTNGHVPEKFNAVVMKAATKEGVAARARLLLCWNCPTCGQKIREG